MATCSLRQLAEKLNLSPATISAALREGKNVKPSTRSRVRAAADAVGYQCNPLASALMAEMRRSKGGSFRGLLSVLSMEGAGSLAAQKYEAQIAAAATRRAGELGFKAEELVCNRGKFDLSRVADILHARGAKGVFLMPSARSSVFARIDWRKLPGVYAGCFEEEPPLNAVCVDYHQAMTLALGKVRSLGYLRPGVVLDNSIQAGVLTRWEAACLSFKHPAKTEPLIAGPNDEGKFREWYSDGGYDVVLAHDPFISQWLVKASGTTGASGAFYCLGLGDDACAGLDLRAEEIGARGMDLLTGQIVRNEGPVASRPTTTMIPAKWVDC